ncbi:hypothetical protein TPHA_0G00130 [Tetrapisispora phaffii CBS 4417]|uniref:Uncharacterized protein n=1 Tax=Tetrapisispora phaffii (strain ATCC 24235 / CBS 4417 / NBRC 1672 / NRRL Y-8282 / UCD 70-5) TaxID=1071381 RepID=G8BVC6_TETPH|nr:hypothetical protein TPHA_0G00130 [Tetrapisispora phaffii CBS 4417]CCE63854.1 hypothetical protein TPHA_0G00130 [Tetrapisispora phaffii CBS 4417]
MTWGNIVKIAMASNTTFPNTTVIDHFEETHTHPEHVIIYNEELGGHFNMSRINKGDGNGVIRISSITDNNYIRKRENLYPICVGQVDADYCRNLSYLAGFSASGWGDMADAVANHMFPSGENEEGYSGYTAAYWKTYLHDESNANWEWYASWRMYYTKDGITPVWTQCDDGK